ncbi:hypothetical protein EDB84DRAFT_1542879 [Lactarius hengduanensis]|nr:hypothetical protein EDB84DRAFT_1542879 [Lactarius hengduanensis]
MRFDHIDWNRAFFKTQDVLREAPLAILLVNFNHIWIILFWFYTAYNATTIYQPKRQHSSILTWSATGAVLVS